MNCQWQQAFDDGENKSVGQLGRKYATYKSILMASRTFGILGQLKAAGVGTRAETGRTRCNRLAVAERCSADLAEPNQHG